MHAALGSPAVEPYSPKPQLVQAPDPATENVPAGHTIAVELVEPPGHAYPAVQLPLHVDTVTPVVAPNSPGAHNPLHVAEVRPDVDPNTPAGHGVHSADPVPAKVPAGHSVTVALVDPGGHAYPAVHDPLHDAVVRPTVAPYVPPGQGPLQVLLYSPGTEP